LSDKNRILRADDWLFNSRWDQIISLRSQIQFVEIATWLVVAPTFPCMYIDLSVQE
jgi:hypothetical protein